MNPLSYLQQATLAWLKEHPLIDIAKLGSLIGLDREEMDRFMKTQLELSDETHLKLRHELLEYGYSS